MAKKIKTVQPTADRRLPSRISVFGIRLIGLFLILFFLVSCTPQATFYQCHVQISRQYLFTQEPVIKDFNCLEKGPCFIEMPTLSLWDFLLGEVRGKMVLIADNQIKSVKKFSSPGIYTLNACAKDYLQIELYNALEEKVDEKILEVS